MQHDSRKEHLAGLTHTHFALDVDLRPLAEIDTSVHGTVFKEMVDFLLGRGTPREAQPPPQLSLTAGSPAAGAGFRHWTPDGALVTSLIQAWMRQLAAARFGGQEIGTPHLYRWAEDQPLHDLAGTFENRLFVTREGAAEHVLRYSADPGFFDYAATLGIRKADLPVRMWEFGPAWRRSRSGELRGIERLHEFRLLDHHTICASGDGLAEYERLLMIQIQEMQRLVGSVAVHFTAVAERLEEFRPMMERAAAALGIPVVVEVISRASHYWALKSFVFVEGPYNTCNLQLDDDNGSRFGLVRDSESISVVHCTLCSVERMILVMVERARRLPHPVLPTWLAPTQVRLLPVNAAIDPSVVLDAFQAAGLRVEIDDRQRSLGWRVRDAAVHWVPALVVFGAADLASGTVELTRRDGSRERGAPAALAELLAEQVRSFPAQRLAHVSTRERYWER